MSEPGFFKLRESVTPGDENSFPDEKRRQTR